MKNNVVIFGIGSLAKYLIEQLSGDYNITGLSRSFSCDVQNQVNYKIGEQIDSSVVKLPKVIIVNFPPQQELSKTLNLIDDYFESNVPLIFVSSTSIYKAETVDESSELNTNSRLYPFEALLTNYERPVTVVRPGGLFDAKRNPANFFKNRTEVSGSNSPVNMVHTLDVARFIKHIISNDLYNDVFNLVASTHPTKREFYGGAMELLDYTLPVFLLKEGSAKVVLNDKSLATGFKYQYDNLLLALKKN